MPTQSSFRRSKLSRSLGYTYERIVDLGAVRDQRWFTVCSPRHTTPHHATPRCTTRPVGPGRPVRPSGRQRQRWMPSSHQPVRLSISRMHPGRVSILAWTVRWLALDRGSVLALHCRKGYAFSPIRREDARRLSGEQHSGDVHHHAQFTGGHRCSPLYTNNICTLMKNICTARKPFFRQSEKWKSFSKNQGKVSGKTCQV